MEYIGTILGTIFQISLWIMEAFITARLSGMIRFTQDYRGNENEVSAVRL
jgi:hypothetical protein